jgi:hypothetical protein
MVGGGSGFDVHNHIGDEAAVDVLNALIHLALLRCGKFPPSLHRHHHYHH